MKIIFDTDVIIEYLRKNFPVVQEIERLMASEASLVITPVVEAEIGEGLRSNEIETTQKALATFECLDVSRTVGRRAGWYMKKYGKSHGVEIADALVAASAHVHHLALCTFNWKHYPMQDIERYRIGR